MKISSEGVKFIASFEGLRLTAYKCDSSEKYYTIGYGHYGPDVKPGMKITATKAKSMLTSDLKTYVSAVNSLVKVKLNQHQFDALVSFAYNCGVGNLKSSTLLKRVNAKRFKDAANEFPKWNKCGGKVLNGLTRRRNAERDLFLK